MNYIALGATFHAGVRAVSVFKTKEFAKFARKSDLGDAELLQAAESLSAGHWDAVLGGGVFKQRIARQGGGKSGGFRAIVVFKSGADCFFVYGFAKNQKSNLTLRELKALKKLAAVLLGLQAEALAKALAAGEISEVRKDNDQSIEEG